MENKPYTAADNVGGPASLLRRILTYSFYGMSASVVVQLLIASQWIGRADALARGWPLLLAVSIGFTLLLLVARRFAFRNQETRAVTLLFVALCVISILVVIALPSALGLALVTPAFGLIIALPYVNRSLFWRLGISSVILAFLLVPISAVLGPMRPAPNSPEIVAQALPLVVASTIVVVLISHMHGWLAGTMRELRESQITLESKVNERTEALQIANKALTAEISQRIIVEQHLNTQASYRSALHELSMGVINCLDSGTMLDAIVTRTCQLLNTPHAFIGLLDEAGEHVSITVAKGSFADMLARGGPMLPTMIGSVGKNEFGEMPLIIEDYEHWPHRLDVVPAGLKACAIYPLQIHENKLAGVLVVAYAEPGRTFDPDKREVLARLSELASIAYSNILLYETVRQNEHALEMRVAERTRELSTLLGVAHNLSGTLNLPLLLQTIFQQLDQLVDYDAGTIFEVQEGALHTLHYAGPEFASYKPGTTWPISGHHLEIVRSGKSINIADVRGDEPMAVMFREISRADWLGEVPAHIVSWIGVPMMVEDRVIGILTLDSATPNHFNARHAELLMAVAQQAALAMENARLYTQASRSAAQAERSRLARDLHDSVSQAIYGIVLASRTLEKLTGANDARMAAPLQHILSLSDAAMAEIRALIFELRPESLEREGILAALNKQADAIRARYGLAVEINLCPTEPAVPLAVKESVYRIAQEAMHNVVKHAHARHLWLNLVCNHETATGILEIRDDGLGFDVNKTCPSQMGLGTMRERAQSIGGRLEIESDPAGGTTVRAIIPIPAPAAAATSTDMPAG